MKLLLDENIPPALGRRLEEVGFEVRMIARFAQGATDDVVLTYAEAAGEVVITADKDFGTLVYHEERAFFGVVLVRTHPISKHLDRIVEVICEHRDELPGSFVVVDEHQVRIRKRRPSG